VLNSYRDSREESSIMNHCESLKISVSFGTACYESALSCLFQARNDTDIKPAQVSFLCFKSFVPRTNNLNLFKPAWILPAVLVSNAEATELWRCSLLLLILRRRG
jgi:hypothetical protein